MITFKRTTSDDVDFQNLILFLDQELKIRDAEEHHFFIQFNKVDKIRNVIIFYNKGLAVGCGSFKKYDNETVEIKRMFVHSNYRGKGIAFQILKELELWAKELEYSNCILETGDKQPEAIRLYQKAEYSIIPNFAQYENIKSRICFQKDI